MKMKRWLTAAAGVLLLSLSFNLNAALATVDDNPWAFDITGLQNVNTYLGFAEWEGSEFDIVETRPQGTSANVAAVAFFDWKVNGIHVSTHGAFGVINEATGALAFLTQLFGADIWITGEFSGDFLSASGEMFGIGRSDLYGTWSAEQITTVIPLTDSAVFMLSAMGALGFVLVPRQRNRNN